MWAHSLPNSALLRSTIGVATELVRALCHDGTRCGLSHRCNWTRRRGTSHASQIPNAHRISLVIVMCGTSINIRQEYDVPRPLSMCPFAFVQPFAVVENHQYAFECGTSNTHTHTQIIASHILKTSFDTEIAFDVLFRDSPLMLIVLKLLSMLWCFSISHWLVPAASRSLVVSKTVLYSQHR